MKLGQFYTEEGLSLYYSYWEAAPAAPSVVYLHGLESHMGWFFNLAEFLNAKGINVYAFDRRGSGLNKNNHRKFSAKLLLSDLKLFLDLIKKEHPSGKVFLLGLCLGGRIAVSFFSPHPDHVDGLILISPSLDSKLKFSLKEKLSMLFRPDSMIKSPIEDRMFTSNEKYLKYIEKDPMRLRYIPGKHLLEIARMKGLLKRASAKIRVPVLTLLAGIDDIIDTGKVRAWHEGLPAADKEIKIYKNYYHLLTFEENAGEIMQGVSDWVWARNNA